MIRRIPALVAGAAGLVVLAGAIGGGIVFAASDDAPPTPPTQNGAPGGDKHQRLDDYLNKLAANLGTTPEALKGALKQTALDEIAQAVKDGKLTADQGKKLTDAINNGTNVPFGPQGLGPKMGGGPKGPNGQNGAAPNGQNRPMGPGDFMGIASSAMNDVAKALGIDAATLKSDLQSGKSIADIAGSDAGKLNAVKGVLTAAAKAEFDKLVQSGKLQQAQADKLLQAFTDNLDTMLKGKFGGFAPMRGPRGNAPNGQNNTNPKPGPSGTS